MAGTLAITAVAVCLTAVGWKIATKIQFIRGYWKKCQSETIATAHGVKCSSWLDDGDSNFKTKTATWFRVNDVIMGGKSISELSSDSEGRLVFSGTINTDGGGFASMRTSEACVVKVPSGATAVKLKVEGGDGYLWKVNLGMGHSLMDSNPTFSHDFLTKKKNNNNNEVSTHTLPLSGFSAQRRGQTLEGVTLEDPSKIKYVGLILSLVTQEGKPNPHFGDGPFRIVLHELEMV
jgi:NADH dehydrogenase [ubiquinone] 1 alpha subcomplex assembly factor 1